MAAGPGSMGPQELGKESDSARRTRMPRHVPENWDRHALRPTMPYHPRIFATHHSLRVAIMYAPPFFTTRRTLVPGKEAPIGIRTRRHNPMIRQNPV